MFDIISQSSTRIKTGIALMVLLLIIGLIDSIFLTWAFLGGFMLIALNESLKLFDVDDDSIYIYAGISWIIAYVYPKPEDLVFIVGIIFASILAYTKNLNKQLFLPLMYPVASYLFLFHYILALGWSPFYGCL